MRCHGLNGGRAMAGLIGSAPIYANGLLSLLFVFVLPGLACASLIRIPDFPQRWFAILLVSLIANHLLVTLIAAFHLDPLLTYRLAFCVVAVAIGTAVVSNRFRAEPVTFVERSTLRASDLGWFIASLVALGVTYFNVWKHGVPNIFVGSDPLISWNHWATIWSQGHFPVDSYGYPQLVPTLWAVTYIFTGSPEQYFAFYVYIGLLVLPILLNAMVLGRMSWWYPLVPGFAFTWFIAEIQMPWLRATLEVGFPDWIAVIFACCGAALFAFSEFDGRSGREKITNALLALCLVSLAAAIKPLHGLLALAVFAGISTDAWKFLKPAARNRFLMAAVGIVAILILLYAIYYAHVQSKALPLPGLDDRLSRAFALFNAAFTMPFKIVVVVGLLLCPFVGRLRWLALPLYVAVAIWANTATYDLRNILSFLLIGAFVPLYAAARYRLEPRILPHARQWQARDGIVATFLALVAFGVTSPLAISDEALRRRFATDQLQIEAGVKINQKIGELLGQGCNVFSSTHSLVHIAAFAPFRSQIKIYFHTLQLEDHFTGGLGASTGCTAILHAPQGTHPSVKEFIETYARDHNLKKVLEDRGLELLVTRQ
jgi:hypothetical protein